jgi:hypothetical protein
MSAITNDPSLGRNFSGLSRIWNVARLQGTNKWQSVGVPAIAMGVIFLANLVIWWLVTASQQPGNTPTNTYNGASFYLYVYMLVVAIQAMSRTFPFALGFSVTRRDYYLGTSLAFLIYSIGYGAALTLLAYIEEWTSGWGMSLTLFRTMFFGADSLALRLFISISAFIVFFVIGIVCGTVYVRWRANGLVTLGVTVALLVIGSVALATLTKSWDRVGEWFVTAGPVGVTAWLLVFSILFAILGFFILRRATPRN